MNDLPNNLANKLSIAVFKIRKMHGKKNSEIAQEIGISTSQLYKMMRGEVDHPTKLIAGAVVNYFEGEITMQDLGYPN